MKWASGENPPPCRKSLITQREAVWHLLGIRPVKRPAKLTAVDLDVLADLPLDVRGVIVPALEMPGAQLTLGVLLITGTLM